MIIYDLNDYRSPDEMQDIHCLFCGSRVGPDDDGSFGDCEHLRLNCTSESWDDPETSKEDFFKDFNEGEEFHFDYIEKKLNDSYFMLRTNSPAPSMLECYFIFRQFPTQS